MAFNEWWDSRPTRENARIAKEDAREIWAAAANACAEACEAVDVETIVGAHDAYLEGRAVAVRRCARAARMISNVELTGAARHERE
jgi:hypothetical protein